MLCNHIDRHMGDDWGRPSGSSLEPLEEAQRNHKMKLFGLDEFLMSA